MDKNFSSISMRHSVFNDRFSEYCEDNDIDVNVVTTEHSETACCQSGDSSTKQITRSGNTGNMFRALEESLWPASLIHEQSEGRLGPAADRSDVP